MTKTPPPQTEPKNAPKDVSRLARRSTEVDKPTIAQTEQKIEEQILALLPNLRAWHDKDGNLYTVEKAVKQIMSILTASNREAIEQYAHEDTPRIQRLITESNREARIDELETMSGQSISHSGNPTELSWQGYIQDRLTKLRRQG